MPYFGLAAYPNYTSAMGAINEGVIKMGKIKTHKATAKRFSLTKNGKVKLNHTNRRHNLGHKTAKRKRQLRCNGYLSTSMAPAVKTLLGE